MQWAIKPRKFTECVECKKLFPAKGNAWYCSDECKDALHKKRIGKVYKYEAKSVEQAKQEIDNSKQVKRKEQTQFINTAKSDVELALKRMGL